MLSLNSYIGGDDHIFINISLLNNGYGGVKAAKLAITLFTKALFIIQSKIYHRAVSLGLAIHIGILIVKLPDLNRNNKGINGNNFKAM